MITKLKSGKCLASYVYNNPSGGYGFGNAEVVFKHYPPTYEDIKEVEKLIMSNYNFSGIVILNYQVLGDD